MTYLPWNAIAHVATKVHWPQDKSLVTIYRYSYTDRVKPLKLTGVFRDMEHDKQKEGLALREDTGHPVDPSPEPGKFLTPKINVYFD